MPNTLFVVDDSATMRKVFELTFAGEDVTIVTHDGADGVLARLREVRPQAAIVDVALGAGSTGYDLVRSIRSEAGVGSIPIYLLYSEHSPLDEPSARSCGAVGAIVKPFESQVLIDKVRQALAVGAKGSVTATTGNVTAPFGNPQAGPAPIGGMPPAPARPAEGAGFTAPRPGGVLSSTSSGATIPKPSSPLAAPVPRPASSPIGATTPGGFSALAGRGVPPPPLPTSQPRPVAAPPMPMPTPPVATAPVSAPVAPERPKAPSTHVAIVEDDVQFEIPAPKPLAKPAEPEPVKPAPAKPADKPAPSVHEKVTSPILEPAADPLVESVARAVEQRVNGLGLTPAQVEAVTALTRDVVERVVWEVVPQLAEVMIREELKRLTAD